MSKTILPFDYDPSLEEYVVNAEAFLSTHLEYDILCTGIAIFDQQGKLLLVQRAAEEHAFPNAWVSDILGMDLPCMPCFRWWLSA